VIEVKGGEVKSSQVKVHVSILSSRRVSLSLPQSLYAPAANHGPALKL
jgi:hypothetical protein